jgi:hypothetical protein
MARDLSPALRREAIRIVLRARGGEPIVTAQLLHEAGMVAAWLVDEHAGSEADASPDAVVAPLSGDRQEDFQQFKDAWAEARRGDAIAALVGRAESSKASGRSAFGGCRSQRLQQRPHQQLRHPI